MKYLYIVISIFSLIALFDVIIGGKLGLGKEFEKGISLIGVMTLSMTGMLILAPCIAYLLSGITSLLPSFIDPSIIASSILANDMGGTTLSTELCLNEEIGYFNGLVVASMMGCTISFNIPFALGTVEKEHRSDVLLGFLCGIVTIPIGCFVGGLFSNIPLGSLIINLLPLILFSILLALCMIKIPTICVKVFSVFGRIIKIVILIGLGAGIFEFLTGTKLIPYSNTIEKGMSVVLNAAWVMTGMFPIVAILSRIFKKPLVLLGKKLNINSVSALGFISSLATNATTFSMIKDMDKRGRILNSAFAISASFSFAGHLAFTLAFNANYLVPMLVGKLTAGLCGLIVAIFICKNGDV